MNRRLAALLFAIISLVGATSEPVAAQYSTARLEGKSRVEILYGFVVGGTDYALAVVYRASPLWDITAGGERATSGGGVATAFALGARYHFAVDRSKYTIDPYLLVSFATASVSTGTTATAYSAGLGSDLRLSDTVEGFGNVGFSTSGGTTNLSYTAGLRFYMAARAYSTLGISGVGNSSAFFAGLGERF